MTIRTTDGRTPHHRLQHMRGTPANPLSVEDIVGKFTANAAGVIPDAAAKRCVATVLALDRPEDVSEVVTLLTP